MWVCISMGDIAAVRVIWVGMVCCVWAASHPAQPWHHRSCCPTVSEAAVDGD